LVALLAALFLFVRPAVAADWAKNFGSSGSLTYITGTTVDAAGNTYIAGSFYGASLTLGTFTLTRVGAQDAFAAKINAAGSVLWAKNFGDSGRTYANQPVSAVASAIAVDSTGNVYLGGDTDSGSLTIPALGPLSAWGASFVLKLDASGATVWAKGFGGAAAIHARSIAVDASGKVYLGGDFGNSGNFNGGVFGAPALTSIGNYDAFAFKLNADGSTAWTKNFGGSGASAYGYGIAVDGSGNVYLGGAFSMANLTTPTLTQIGGGDAFALKLNASGNTLWAKNYGGSGALVQANGIAVDGSGNVYLGGNFQYGALTTPVLSRIGIQDAFAFKLDSGGSTVWAKNFGGSGLNASVNAIAIDAGGNVALGGSFDAVHSSGTNLTTPALTRIGIGDAFAFKLDASGAIGLAKNYGGSGASATVSGIALDASGNITLGGNFSGDLTTPVLTAVSSWDGFVLKQAIPLNGVCGAANGIASTFAPTTGLCVAGTPGAVTAGSPWAWSCAGANTGTSSLCTAPNQSTGSGSGRVAISGGGAGAWVADTGSVGGVPNSAGFIPTSGNAKSPPSLPPGYSFPYGLLDFTLTGGTKGSAASIVITYPAAVPTNAVYWKYGPSPAGYDCSGAVCAEPHWYRLPAAQVAIAENTVTLTITDGDVGDDDLSANGSIVDAGGPGVPLGAEGGVKGVPTLSQWGMAMLIFLIGWMTLPALRKGR
jgi:hypothetical protein